MIFHNYFDIQSIGAQAVESTSIPGAVYPRDVPLCAARVGRFLIANPGTTDRSILEDGAARRLQLLPVFDGYSLCVCTKDAARVALREL